MTAMTTFVDNTTAEAAEVNTNFGHRATTGSTPVSFIPTDATTNVVIIAKADFTKSAASISGTMTLVSDQDGTLDSCKYESETGGGTSISNASVLFTGNLSAATHSISVAGSDGTIGNVKITIFEFLG